MNEKEAIERLKLCSNNECNICGRYEKEECMLERNRCEKTVLKALEQKDKEIAEEKIKYISSNLNNTIKQRQKEDEQLNALNEGWKIELEQKDEEIQELKEKWNKDTHTLQNQLDLANADRVEKDKIIGLMAEYMEEEFAEYQLDNIYAELYNCNGMERNWTRGKEKEIEDIKQYFQKKAREEND